MSRKPLQAAILGAGATALAVALWLSGTLDRFEYASWTWRVRSMAKPSPSTDRIKIILIDQASLDWAAKENQLSWPWPRQAYAPVIDFCRRAGAKVIVFDMLFSEPSGAGVEDDDAFGEVIGRRRDFVQAFFMGRQSTQSTNWPAEIPRPAWALSGRPDAGLREAGATFPVRQVATNAALLASVKAEPDEDGVYRRVAPYRVFNDQAVPLLGLAAALGPMKTEERDVRLVDDGMRVGDRSLPLDGASAALLHFRGRSGTHESFSAAAIIQSELRLLEGGKPVIQPDELTDCYVFFGVSAPALKDLKSTPVAGDYPGVEVHATFLDNLLEGDFLRDAPRPAVVALILLLAMGAAFLVLLSRNGTQASVVIVVLLLVPIGVGFGAYAAGWWWPMVGSWVGIGSALTGATLLSYATEGRQKRFIKSAFKQYLSGDVIEQLLDDPSRLQLGGEKRELTMFFSDLKGFSSISEALDPADLTSLMNDVLSDMCEIIQEEGGTLDKFIGDAIVAFWNAPLPQPDHAVRAVRAAIRCQRKLDTRRDDLLARTNQIPLYMRIGINTGAVVVGNMGSRQRFNYTMLGDAANLASRLEGANKAFGTYIMVAESTWTQVQGQFPGREIASIRVVGRTAPVRVFEPLGLPGEERPSRLEHYEQAIALVRERRWDQAYDFFADITNDALAAKYAERCLNLRDGVLKDWDGVWNLTEK